MGFLMVILLSFFFISFGPKTASAANFDVTSYGAVGDGETDDTWAFVNAWRDVCGDTSEDPTLIIPSDRTFLIQCVSFNGPCASSSVHVQLLGAITAPKSRDWGGCNNGHLLYFASVNGLIMDGSGQIDGQGSIWWPRVRDVKRHNGPTCNNCPSMIRFKRCGGLQLRDITFINSPKRHISILNCEGADLGSLHISAPEYSPNTDGIGVTGSSHVNIHDSVIETGDDCVAITSGTYDINVTGIMCGPGHGISIGSLGKHNERSTVEQVLVRDCNITGTTNGLRIKTIPHGKGYARSISFENIQLENVKNPIIIDQHYCLNMANADCRAPPSASAVKVSDVKYTNIHGSSAAKKAIIFNCVEKYKCSGIETNDVQITGEGVYAYCQNTNGKFIDTSPEVTCNQVVMFAPSPNQKWY